MKQTTLYSVIKNLGGKMVPFAGYEMPVKFSSELKEHKQVRESVGIFDVSHMGEIFVTGKDALSFCNFVTTNDVSLLKDGDVQYTVITNEHGGAVDDTEQ
jgi:aminomethyltransferase